MTDPNEETRLMAKEQSEHEFEILFSGGNPSVMDFNEQELEQVNQCLRETIQNLTAKITEQAQEIQALRERVRKAEIFFDKVSVGALANITRKDSGL